VESSAARLAAFVRIAICQVVFATWLVARCALAETVSPAPSSATPAGGAAPTAAEPPATLAKPTPKPQVIAYDGRAPEPTTAGDVLLWVPRIVLAPLYLIGEFVVRRPLAVAIPGAERADLPRKVYDFFLFAPGHKGGVVPVGYVDFDFNPSVGLYAFWRDAFAAGNDWSVHTELWPTDWYALSVKESARIDARTSLQFHLSVVHRPDRVFYGIGARSLQSDQSRFTQAIADESANLDWRPARRSRMQLAVGLRSQETGPGSYGADPSLERQAATGAFPLPYGFGLRYAAAYTRALVALDTRDPWPMPGDGARVELQADQGSGLGASATTSWIRYGAVLAGFWDLDQHQRVLGLSLTARFADPLGQTPIPFTELASLGGDGPMRGYFSGRMVGRSAAAAALRYTWPIGPWLGGAIEGAVGNVFDAHLQGFRPQLLRFSGDIGITTAGLTDYPIEGIVGVGSETFEHGGQVDSVRVTLSVNHGF